MNKSQLINLTVLLPTNRVDEYFIQAFRSAVTDLPTSAELLVVLNGEALHADLSNLGWVASNQSVRIVKSIENGLVNALNLGLELAAGDLIARMDGDDLIVPGRLSKQMAFFQMHKKMVLLGTQFQQICEHGVLGGVSALPKIVRRRPFPPLFNRIAHPTAMFKKETALLVGGYSNRWAHVEDQDLWLRMMPFGEVRNLKEVLLNYRVHKGQISIKNSRLQNLNLLKTYLGNFKNPSLVLEIDSAVEVREIMDKLRSATGFSWLEKGFLRQVVKYWEFAISFPKDFVSITKRGFSHPLLAGVFAWSNRRIIFRLSKAERKVCSECENVKNP
jgi:glycosyltransferase involved in cell wall biosynthesis